jgi:hypothetical protein
MLGEQVVGQWMGSIGSAAPGVLLRRQWSHPGAHASGLFSTQINALIGKWRLALPCREPPMTAMGHGLPWRLR